MGSIAERLGRRAPTPAQRDHLTLGAVLVTVDISNRDRTAHEIWTVLSGLDNHRFVGHHDTVPSEPAAVAAELGTPGTTEARSVLDPRVQRNDELVAGHRGAARDLSPPQSAKTAREWAMKNVWSCPECGSSSL